MAWRQAVPLEELLVRGRCTALGVSMSNTWLKEKVLEAGMLEERCDECGLESVWQSAPLTLEMHHRDCDWDNNEIANLQILCPNCHSQKPGRGTRGKARPGRQKSGTQRLRKMEYDQAGAFLLDEEERREDELVMFYAADVDPR